MVIHSTVSFHHLFRWATSLLAPRSKCVLWEPMRAIEQNLGVDDFVAERKQKGQTLVEFALVALIFFVILFGLIEFARALWTWNTIAQATRAGARFAVVEAPTGADTEVKNYVVYLNSAGTGTPVLPGLTVSNVTVEYLDLSTNPATVAGTVS